MLVKTFKGGIHPGSRKSPTEILPIERAMPSSGMVWIPVTQGGAPNVALVKPGDEVARGQVIAMSESPMSVPVHASISGTVKKIERRLVTGNADCPCVCVEADGSGRTAFMEPLDPFSCSREEALARVRDSGLVGMGGAAFPAFVKLNPPKGTKIDYLIANGAECEPYLSADSRLMRERASKVVDGLAIAMRITGAGQGIIAIEDDKRDIAPILETAIAGLRARGVEAGPITVAVCKSKYPQGGEKTLITVLTGREVPSLGIPAACGCVVQNVGTLAAISEAFREGKPLVDRVLTLSGGACETPRNLEVPVGTLVSDLIPDAVRLKAGVAKIVSGGPMMGVAMKGADFPVQKNTSGVLFLTAKETSLVEETPCIGCGFCVKACPYGLSPVLMVRAMDSGDLAEASRCGLVDCVECGACSYVCPARIRLVQRFRVGKELLRAERRKEEARKAQRAPDRNAATGVAKGGA